MIVRPVRREDLDAWAALRFDLWPDGSIEEHRAEAAEALGDEDLATFVAETPDGAIAGFLEAALRHDYGCETSPVAFVEGLYVRPAYRKADVGRLLCAAATDWGRAMGCSELASDALAYNVESHAFHRAVGFEETEQVIYFRKTL